MKIMIYFLGLFLFLSPVAAEDEANEYVKTSISFQSKVNKIGGKGTLNISFKPNKGIYIHAEPEVEVELDSNIVIIEKVQLSTEENGDYLDIKKPVKANFKIRNNLKEGTYKLKGSLIYFYCSEKEGWCSRFKQPINLNLKVVK